MTQHTQEQVTIGIDLGDRSSEICVLDEHGSVIARTSAPTHEATLAKAVQGYSGARVAFEAGTHSPWLARRLEAEGFEVIVANTRKVQLISSSDRKNDVADAELLARLARSDPKLLHPIAPRGEQVQRDRALLRVREGLVAARTHAINQARGIAKSLGKTLPSCGAATFHNRMAPHADLFPGFDVLLATLQSLHRQIREVDRRLEALEERYPQVRLLRQVPGVGKLTALQYVMSIEDPGRFDRSRSVGAYVGLVPRQRDSGDSRPELRITKAGDPALRRQLVLAANYILTSRAPDTDLQRFGNKLLERGGKRARKRAVVAVARKLAVLLHSLWRTGEEYVPIGHAA